MAATLIAITGGIGAGKSVVSRILTTLGYPVYDCDTRAKQLMDSSAEIKRRIAAEIAPEAISGDTICRPVLAEIVFNDPRKLRALNAIVHHHVREDIAMEARRTPSPILFVETAILYESQLDAMVSQVWDVTAPEPIRIQRIIARNHCTPAQAQSRIDSQRTPVTAPHPAIHTLINDNLTPLLPQVLQLLRHL